MRSSESVSFESRVVLPQTLHAAPCTLINFESESSLVL